MLQSTSLWPAGSFLWFCATNHVLVWPWSHLREPNMSGKSWNVPFRRGKWFEGSCLIAEWHEIVFQDCWSATVWPVQLQSEVAPLREQHLKIHLWLCDFQPANEHNDGLIVMMWCGKTDDRRSYRLGTNCQFLDFFFLFIWILHCLVAVFHPLFRLLPSLQPASRLFLLPLLFWHLSHSSYFVFFPLFLQFLSWTLWMDLVPLQITIYLSYRFFFSLLCIPAFDLFFQQILGHEVSMKQKEKAHWDIFLYKATGKNKYAYA